MSDARAEYLKHCMQPWHATDCNCATAAAVALRDYRAARLAFARFARLPRAERIDLAHGRADMLATAERVAGAPDRPDDGPAWGVADLGDRRAIVVRLGDVWLARAQPRGVARVDPSRILAHWSA